MSDPRTPDPSGWWDHLLAASLVGTARRPVPPLDAAGLGVRARTDARPETALLDAAALAGALRAAGTVMPTAPAGTAPTGGPASADGTQPASRPAPPESRPAAPPRAAQLLSLVLVQNPAGPSSLEPLVRHWCTTAVRHGYRLPHALLPQVLELGRSRPGLRVPLVLTLGERGRWLAERVPGAEWVARTSARADADLGAASPDRAAATADTLPDVAAWALLADAQRLTALRAARERDPSLGRAYVEGTWSTDPARTRKAHLELLEIGLGDADEDLLERALDDRAAGVRALAATLLDGLPRSARAARMGDRLRALLHTDRRLLRTRLDVELPDDPDPAGVRDGLVPPPRGVSARAWWLQRIVAGAPLSIWTDATGTDPEATYGLIPSDEARAGVREAVLRRGDRGWAQAIARTRGARRNPLDPAIVALLDPAEAERLVLAGAEVGGAALATVVQGAPPRWSRALTLGLLDRCRRTRTSADLAPPLVQLVARAGDLHPDGLPVLQDWLATDPPPEPARRLLRELVQLLSLYRSIEEAFAP
ncbi:hypothetical protein GCM10009584_24900 [Ornithinimicrobium humiphilum]|uniref:Uncharacterized protein n=1 Tax=Ornithinimicrobium humiphilum TaxID=125288 RepID=A0A543KMB8_9MICO|nr:DUF5691 domain-containing protein [Ornithinimicrobium humiphilum]TQM96220.1 hypothetical protein FB476_1084 [Ornithinimicrobium humiphilum]